MASSSSSPCAACKFLRRKCTQECVFAPYFPPEDPHKFSMVHKVFGASNVAKLLNELNPAQREDAVSSLAYEAITRLNDPVYGCVGIIFILQQQLRQIQTDIFSAHKELSTYLGQSALLPLSHSPNILHQLLPVGAASTVAALPPSSAISHTPFGIASNLMPNLPEQHQQHVLHHQTQQVAAALSAHDQQEMLRNYKQQQQQQHQQELSNSRFNGNLDGDGNAVVTAMGGRYNQINLLTASASSLALVPIENPFPVQQADADHHKPKPPPHHHHLSLQHQQQQQHLRSTSDDSQSVGPSA